MKRPGGEPLIPRPNTHTHTCYDSDTITKFLCWWQVQKKAVQRNHLESICKCHLIVFNPFCSINSNKLVFWCFLCLDLLFYHLFLSKVLLERCARLSLFNINVNCFDIFLSNAMQFLVGLLSKILFECIANASAKQLWMSYIPCYPFLFLYLLRLRIS